jgi:hypothetical protein
VCRIDKSAGAVEPNRAPPDMSPPAPRERCQMLRPAAAQMVGRGLRGAKCGGTESCVIIDCEDNNYRAERPELGYRRFREVWRPKRRGVSRVAPVRRSGVIARCSKEGSSSIRPYLKRYVPTCIPVPKDGRVPAATLGDE